mgnify:FL=1
MVRKTHLVWFQAHETLKGLAFKETDFLAKKKVMICLSRKNLCDFHLSSSGVTEQMNNLSFSFFFSIVVAEPQ